MANTPPSRNWNDVQVAIATISMALTLAFWNLFAGPDREAFIKRAQAQAAQDQATQAPALQLQAQPQSAPAVIAQPAPTQMSGPILLGGNAPQTVIVQQGGGGNGGGSRGGGAGGGTGGS